MRPSTFSADSLRQFLRRSTTAALPELKRALGTRVDLTVFRKLKQLDCLTSYQKILNFIRTTNTRGGLQVSAYLDRRCYPTGVSPLRHEIEQLHLKRASTQPESSRFVAAARPEARFSVSPRERSSSRSPGTWK